MPLKTALILAGHGSHISPQTAGLVWNQVDILRARGIADEVTAAFWKETPAFSTVLNSLMAEDITIVPLFTALGFFTRTVIPAEMGLMGLDAGVTRRQNRTLRYARPLGEHLYIGEMVRRRVDDALKASDFPPDQVGVAVIGHGTSRNRNSRDTTLTQADALRAAGVVREAVAVFLDDTPSIPDLFDLLASPYIIAVPNFLALGSHTTLDVPGALGLPANKTHATISGRSVWYTDPLGLNVSLSDAILDLARDAGMPAQKSSARGFPAAGCDELIAAVQAAGEFSLGQLTLTPNQVRSGSGALRMNDLASLRDHVRTMPAFRPLASSLDFPAGWRTDITSPEQIHEVVETVYPGMVADWAAHRRGEFHAQPFETVIARQVGQYRRLADLPPDEVDEVIRQTCVQCVCHPTWQSGTSPQSAIPCAEPCNVWLDKAVERLESKLTQRHEHGG